MACEVPWSPARLLGTAADRAAAIRHGRCTAAACVLRTRVGLTFNSPLTRASLTTEDEASIRAGATGGTDRSGRPRLLRRREESARRQGREGVKGGRSDGPDGQ